MELFAKIVNEFQPLTIFEKSSILDVWLGIERASGKRFFSAFHTFSKSLNNLEQNMLTSFCFWEDDSEKLYTWR